MKLLPTFYKELADAYFQKKYKSTLDKIQTTRGELSDDGDKWVDKYSGYIIKYKESISDPLLVNRFSL